MKLIEFKEYNNLNENRVLNKKKLAFFIILILIIVIAITFYITYVFSPKFRNWADMHILMKTVYEGKLASVELDKDEKTDIYAYDKYVAMLKENKLEIYNSSAKKIGNININISNPMFKSNGKYLAIGEKGKQKLYLISGTKQLWSVDIEGVLSRVSVNENGYVSVVSTGTTYKSVIVVYDTNGTELLKTFIPSNTVIDTAISSDNKYLSFAEINTSGTLIKSQVKTIAINKSNTESELKCINTYEIEPNSIILNLKYQGSKNLICMCNNGTYILADGNTQKILDFEEENKNYTYAGIDLFNTIYEIEETVDNIQSQTSIVKMINTGTKKQSEYSLANIAKSTISAGDNIAINTGTEAYFITTRGWLKKKYIANQEIKEIVISDRIAAIIFRDKIEILLL